jgi:hypothetical protein
MVWKELQEWPNPAAPARKMETKHQKTSPLIAAGLNCHMAGGVECGFVRQIS